MRECEASKSPPLKPYYSSKISECLEKKIPKTTVTKWWFPDYIGGVAGRLSPVGLLASETWDQYAGARPNFLVSSALSRTQSDPFARESVLCAFLPSFCNIFNFSRPSDTHLKTNIKMKFNEHFEGYILYLPCKVTSCLAR